MLEIMKIPNTDVRIDDVKSEWGTIHHLHVHLWCPLTGKEVWVRGILTVQDYEALLAFRAAGEPRRRQIREEVDEAHRDLAARIAEGNKVPREDHPFKRLGEQLGGEQDGRATMDGIKRGGTADENEA